MVIRKLYQIIIVVLFASLCIGCAKHDFYVMSAIDSNFSSAVSKEINIDNGNIEVYRIVNDEIYGAVVNYDEHPILYGTNDLIVYNLKNDRIKLYSLDLIGRIIDFYISDEYIYYIEVSDSNGFNWCLKKYSINDNSYNVLKCGVIQDIINTPRILGVYGQSLIVFMMDKSSLKIEYEFVKFDNEIETLISGSGDVANRLGEFPYNTYNYYLSNGIIYYSLLDGEGNQKVMSYDIFDKDLEIIFENNSNNGFLNNYKMNGKYCYFQLITSYNSNSKSFIKTNGSLKSFSSSINTFDNFIAYNKLLFHNKGNVWKLLNLDTGKFQLLKLNIDAYPKYYIISENKILIKDKTGRYYIVEVALIK